MSTSLFLFHLPASIHASSQQAAAMAPARCRRALLLLLLLACAISHNTAFLLPAGPRLPHAPAATRSLSARSLAASPISMSAAPAAPSPSTGGEENKKMKGGNKLVFKGLRSERFRHPLDQQATEQLRRLPGLEWVVRRLMRVAEEAVYLVRACVRAWYRFDRPIQGPINPSIYSH